MTFKPEPFTLYPSKNKSKKYDIYVPTKNGKLRKISFGGKGYNDFTTYYRKDPNMARERRRLYRIRHAGDRLNDPYSSGFWSWYVLWNKPNIGESLEDAIKRAKELI